MFNTVHDAVRYVQRANFVQTVFADRVYIGLQLLFKMNIPLFTYCATILTGLADPSVSLSTNSKAKTGANAPQDKGNGQFSVQKVKGRG